MPWFCAVEVEYVYRAMLWKAESEKGKKREKREGGRAGGGKSR